MNASERSFEDDKDDKDENPADDDDDEAIPDSTLDAEIQVRGSMPKVSYRHSHLSRRLCVN